MAMLRALQASFETLILIKFRDQFDKFSLAQTTFPTTKGNFTKIYQDDEKYGFSILCLHI